MTIQPTEYVRPDWRQVNINLLADKLYAAYHESAFHDVPMQLHGKSTITVADWERVAEAAVDELIDRPEREFQAQLATVLGREAEEDAERHDSVAAREWREATASDWLPEHA